MNQFITNSRSHATANRYFTVRLLLFFGLILGGGIISAQIPFLSDELPNAQQRNCSTESFFQQNKTPEWVANRLEIEEQTRRFVQNAQQNGLSERNTYTIAVVVHVVWNGNVENISDAQIQSQIDVLNQDFRRQNADRIQTPTAFQGIAADVGINFCLARRTPDNLATNGIERKYATTTEWGATDNVKRPERGGLAAWDPMRYLNIWVCNIGGGWLGYAQYPGGPTATDGVVIDYRYFGTTGAVLPPFNRGRTTTHEVGHWLNLNHIWGDAGCGNDGVDDTPVHRGANYGCPQQPLLANQCAANIQEMPSNFMDYTNDACMNLFTNGQRLRMIAQLSGSGARANVGNSLGCMPPPVQLPCNAPQNLVSSGVSPYAAQLNWLAVNNVEYYLVETRPNTPSSFWSSYYSPTNQLKITNFRPSTSYFVRVRAVCTGVTANVGAYSAPILVNTPAALITLPTAACEDANEPNNNFGTAKRMNFNSTINAAISSATDRDWFVVTVPTSVPTVRFLVSNLAADYDLKVFNSSGILVATSENQGTANEIVLLNNPVSGDYYVQIFGYNGAFQATRCYSFRCESVVGLTARKARESAFESVQIFPNPTNGEAFLHAESGWSAGVLSVQIFDMSGKLCWSKNFENLESTTDLKLSIQDLQTGFYQVKIIQQETVKILKLMKN